MPTAIKIGDELAEDARDAAKNADRSLTGQVEHWARIGRGIEEWLPASAIALLKKCGGNPDDLEDEMEKRRLFDILQKVRENSDFTSWRKMILDNNSPAYEKDPNDQEKVVQVWPNGQKIPGRFVNRQFVPEA